MRLNNGLTLENIIVDSHERRKKPDLIDKGRGVKIPKLDFSTIIIQREAPISGEKKQQPAKGTAEDPSSATSSEEEFSDEEMPNIKAMNDTITAK